MAEISSKIGGANGSQAGPNSTAPKEKAEDQKTTDSKNGDDLETSEQLKKLSSEETTKREIKFAHLEDQTNEDDTAEKSPFIKFLEGVRKSDFFKFLQPLFPLMGLFFMYNAITEAKDRWFNIITGSVIGTLGLTIEKFLFPMIDTVVDPVKESKVDLDKDIVWDEDSKRSFNRALKQFLGYKSLVQTSAKVKQVGTHKGGLLILAGPPGTGKSAMADGIAGLCGNKIIKAKVTGVEDKFVGESEKNIESYFKRAEKQGAILFFDEADALFRPRYSGDVNGAHAAKLTNTFIQLFNEYQGKVKVILATNTPDNIDQAIKSRGYLANIKPPNLTQRLQILIKKLVAYNLKKENVLSLIDNRFERLKELVKKYKDFTGRSIEAAVVEAMHIAEDRIKDLEALGKKDKSQNELLVDDLEKSFDGISENEKLADKSALKNNSEPLSKLASFIASASKN